MIKTIFSSFCTSDICSVIWADAACLSVKKAASSSYINHFLQPDTIIPDWTNPQTLNRYAYTLGNPVRYNDPSGHDVGCPGDDDCNPNTPPNRGSGGSSGGGGVVGTTTSKGYRSLKDPSKPASVNDFIYSEFVSPLADPVCRSAFSFQPDLCNNGFPALPIRKGTGNLPTFYELVCGSRSGLACAATVTQDIATAIDAAGVVWIEAPLFAAGCSLGGPGGCIAGEGAAAGLWFVSGNWGETVFSGASLVFTVADDYFNYGFNYGAWKNSYTSGGTFLAGTLPLPPSWDLAVDMYGSAYNHGAVNGLDVILSGGNILK